MQGEHLRDLGSMREAIWAQAGRREAQVEPRWTQVGAMLGLDGPNMIQDGPPSWAKMVPSWSNMGPRWSKLGQDEPMMVQVRSKRRPFRVRCRLYWFLHGLRSAPPGGQERILFPCWERVQGCIYIRSRDTGLGLGC